MNDAAKLASLEELIVDLDGLIAEKQNELDLLTDERRGLLLSRNRLLSAHMTVPGTEPVRLPPPLEQRPPAPTSYRIYGGHNLLSGPDDDDGDDGPSGNFTEDVRQVLQEATRPLSASQIVDTLNERGYQLTESKKVRGALAYLKRTGKADWPEPNRWMWIGSPVWDRYMSERQQQPDVFTSTEAPSEMEEASGSGNTNQEIVQQSPVAAG